MDELIEALQLMATKEKPTYPTHCEHDVLTVCVAPSLFTPEEIDRLDRLGFVPDDEGESFQSFRFGSA